jgi:TMEM175 potassium channel family protein
MSPQATKKGTSGTQTIGPNHPINTDETGLERIVFFSDAVMAIAITLLALEIRLPGTETNLSDAQLLTTLGSLWHRYLGYFISFMVIGMYWLSHHRMFRSIRRYDSRLMLLNLVFLLLIGFIPFPTTVIMEYSGLTATVFYAATMVAVGLASSTIWWYATQNNRLTQPPLSDELIQRRRLRLLIAPGIFLASIGLAFINADLAKFSWITIYFAYMANQ